MQVVINKCHGGFSLSKQALQAYARLKGIELGAYNEAIGYYENLNECDIARDDPALVRVVLDMGDTADGRYAKLKVVTIPDDVEYTIEEYDGSEWIAEVHRTWG